MPDPVLYAKAIGASILASVVFLLLAWACKRYWPKSAWSIFTLLAIAGGLFAGSYVLGTANWFPPKNALDRLMLVVLPTVLMVELAALWKRLPRWVVWVARLIVAALLPRVMFHDSVYLSGTSPAFPFWYSLIVMLVGSCLLMTSWSLLVWLGRRTLAVTVGAALQMAILAAGLTIMMAGYLQGGEASFPIVITVATVLLGGWLLSVSPKEGDPLIGVSVASLFGLLFIGVYFGELSTIRALVIFAAPWLLWLTELPKVRAMKPVWKSTIGLVLVAAALLVILVLAKQQFDREMAPLL